MGCIMYRRRVLCNLYGAVDFLNVLKKGWWGGGVVEVPVHNEIHYENVARLKTITYRAIKTTCTLIVNYVSIFYPLKGALVLSYHCA
jgi:hypothetical protein